jgi:transposase
VEGRTAQGVRGWLAARSAPWLAAIETVTLDPYQGYARGIADWLPRAELVVDHFHAVRLANPALDEIHRRVQRRASATAGRKATRCTGSAASSSWRMSGSPSEVGPHPGRPRLPATPTARSAPPTSPRNCCDRSRHHFPRVARRRLERFSTHCRDADVIELDRLAATIRRWEHEILGWHRTGLTNGPTEAMNLLVKKIKRVDHGFRNFNDYRLRLLLHCGTPWVAHSTRRTNQRPPTTLGRVEPFPQLTCDAHFVGRSPRGRRLTRPRRWVSGRDGHGWGQIAPANDQLLC